MKASAIMTPDPVTVHPTDGLQRALELMDSQDFRHLPVVEEGRLLGIISERDVLEGLGRIPGQSFDQEDDDLAPFRPQQVSDIVLTDVKTVSPAERIDGVAAVLVGLGIGCTPVLDDGQLTGIVTEMDMLATYVKLVEAGTLVENQQPQVVDAMSDHVSSVTPDTLLQDAFSVCLSRNVRHLPVVKAGRLVGLVSDRDLRAAATSSVPEPITIDQLMARQVVTIGPIERLPEAARIMYDQKIGTLPVMRDDVLIGILSLSDVMAHCVRALDSHEF